MVENAGCLVGDSLVSSATLMDCHVQEDFSGATFLKEHVMETAGIGDVQLTYVSACKVNVASPSLGTCAIGPTPKFQHRSFVEPILDVPAAPSPMHGSSTKAISIPPVDVQVHPCPNRTWKRKKIGSSGEAIIFGVMS